MLRRSLRSLAVLGVLAAVGCTLEPLWIGSDSVDIDTEQVSAGQVLRATTQLQWVAPEAGGRAAVSVWLSAEGDDLPPIAVLIRDEAGTLLSCQEFDDWGAGVSAGGPVWKGASLEGELAEVTANIEVQVLDGATAVVGELWMSVQSLDGASGCGAETETIDATMAIEAIGVFEADAGVLGCPEGDTGDTGDTA